MTPSARPLGRLSRLAALLLAAALVGMLGVARSLRPDPRGLGTHEQLGLAPCGVLARTGRPCPTCGMTTALAWFARGRPDRAWRANPAGLALGLECLVGVPWLLVASARGRPVGSRSLGGPLVVGVVATVAFGLAAWSLSHFLGRI
jgi:hypothetical protein